MAFCSPVPVASTGTASPSSKKAVCKRVRLRASAQSGNNGNSNISRRETLVRFGSAVTAAVLATNAAAPAPVQALSQKRVLAKAGPVVELPGGITYREITVGNGITPKSGDTVAIHYSLFYDDFEVESSRESQGLAASPIGFTFDSDVGDRTDRTDRSANILPAINIGIAGMKVGGLRWIETPPTFAYGNKGRKPMIPPGATVQFAVQLLSCKRSGSNPNISVGNSSVF